jgi:hypothetical protein
MSKISIMNINVLTSMRMVSLAWKSTFIYIYIYIYIFDNVGNHSKEEPFELVSKQ